MECLYMNIGQAVKMLRKRKGLTQSDLASKISAYDTTNLSRFERGDQGIASRKLAEIAKILEVSVSTLHAIAETDGKLLDSKNLDSSKHLISYNSADLWKGNVTPGPSDTRKNTSYIICASRQMDGY